MSMDRLEVELHVSAGILPAVVVLLRRDAADRVRRMHDKSVDVLVGIVPVFHLVVYRREMLTTSGLATCIAISLAALAGFAQLFSP